jgi:hypothetical protein
MLSLPRIEVPRLVLILPRDIARAPAEAGLYDRCRAWCEKSQQDLGVTEYYTLYVCDEGPALLGEGQGALVPLGSGMDMALPGSAIRNLGDVYRECGTPGL